MTSSILCACQRDRETSLGYVCHRLLPNWNDGLVGTAETIRHRDSWRQTWSRTILSRTEMGMSPYSRRYYTRHSGREVYSWCALPLLCRVSCFAPYRWARISNTLEATVMIIDCTIESLIRLSLCAASPFDEGDTEFAAMVSHRIS